MSTTRPKPETLRRKSRDARIAQAAFRKALGRRDASAFDFQADTPMIGFSAPGIVSDKAMRDAKRKAMEAVRADKLLRRRGCERRVGDHLPTKASRMGRKRTNNPDHKTPAGQLALYLQYLIGDDATKIAKQTGISRATIFNYMGGTTSPSVENLNLIAKALGKSDYRDLIPPDDFVDGIGGNKRRKR